MDNRVKHDVTQQRAVLKTLTKNFQGEIRIYNEGIYVSELCKDSLHLTENANKMFLEFIERLFHTTSTQKSGTLGTSFSHLYSTAFFTKWEQKYWTLRETYL